MSKEYEKKPDRTFDSIIKAISDLHNSIESLSKIIDHHSRDIKELMEDLDHRNEERDAEYDD